MGYKSRPIGYFKFDIEFCKKCKKVKKVCKCEEAIMSKKEGIILITILIVFLAIFIRFSPQIEDPRVIKTLENISIGLIIVGVAMWIGCCIFGRKG